MKNNKLMLKTQQRFGSEKHVFTEEINIIALSSSDEKKKKKCNQLIGQKNMHMEQPKI